VSTPARSLAYSGGHCCDGAKPVPFYAIGLLIPSHAPVMRAAMIAAMQKQGLSAALATEVADEPWCPRCSTALEDLRDGFADIAPTFFRVIATVAAFIPGIGTAAATAFGAAAALAAGDSISDAMVSAAKAAVPGGAALEVAAASGAALIEGKNVGDAALAGARALAKQQGGPLAAAAFDSVVAIAQGEALQDAGFAALKSLAKGNDLAERAASYAQKMTTAATSGQPLEQVLAKDLRDEVMNVAGVHAQRYVTQALGVIASDPAMASVGSGVLAQAAGVAEPIARAAQAIMRTGEPDAELASVLTSYQLPGIATGIAKSDQTTRLPWAPLEVHNIKQATTAINVSAVRQYLDAQPKAFAVYVAASDRGAPSSAPLVQAARPASRAGVAGDVLLGGTVAAAGLALYLFFHGSD
jgi:hypothetical protein